MWRRFRRKARVFAAVSLAWPFLRAQWPIIRQRMSDLIESDPVVAAFVDEVEALIDEIKDAF